MHIIHACNEGEGADRRRRRRKRRRKKRRRGEEEGKEEVEEEEEVVVVVLSASVKLHLEQNRQFFRVFECEKVLAWFGDKGSRNRA